jgi:hypothetical protein
MRLLDLEPQFYRHAYQTNPDGKQQELLHKVDTVAEAQGVMFACPKCFAANGGLVGTHYVLCWFRDRGVPDEMKPNPGRWAVSGSGYHDLTLSPSILLHSDCGWHGWVTNGQAT